ncbi:MAG: hypothetical protein QMC77_03880 [Methanocellales archaeon]|nr:hypothetical protein [Methanocellales archaeon]
MVKDMGTITVNVKDEVEKDFREAASTLYGRKKGALGRAITEAMQNWVYVKKQKEIAKRELKLLNKGFNFGKKLYRSRDELYER